MGAHDIGIATKRMPSFMRRYANMKKLPSTSGSGSRSYAAAATSNVDPGPGQGLKPYPSDADEGVPESGSRSEEDAASLHMDPLLYRAARHYEVDAFSQVLNRVSIEKQLSVCEIIRSTTPEKNTLVHLAALYSNFNLLKLVCEMYPPIVSKRNSKGDTVLHVAARSGFGNGIHYLLSHQRDVFFFQEVSLVAELLVVRNSQGNTALHEAILFGSTSVFGMLVVAAPRISFWLNKESKSPFYLAVQAGDLSCIKVVLQHKEVESEPSDMLKGNSPLLAAANTSNLEILRLMLEEEPRFVDSRDDGEGRYLLHCAAYTGFLDGVRFLVGKHAESAYRRTYSGLFPVHLAAMKGHIDIIRELFRDCPYPGEMLSADGRSILHVACISGRHNVVEYILETRELEELINQRDKDGNTPLHLATMEWHPRIVSLLTRDDRVNLALVNKKGFTAMECVCSMYDATKLQSFRKRLTWMALDDAGAPRSSLESLLIKTNQHSKQEEPVSVEIYEHRVNTLLLVSTLVATVSFAAGFTAPGGYKNSDPNQGTAILLQYKMFHMFILCDTLAMYSSITVAVTLIWAQLGDIYLINNAMWLAMPLLGIALLMMSLAFMAGTYLAVSTLSWLSWCVLIMSLVFVVIISLLFLPLFFPTSSRWKVIRFIGYGKFKLLMMATGSYTTSIETVG